LSSRRQIALLLVVVLLLVGSAAGQPSVPRIGFVSATWPGPSTDEFRQSLKALGWVEGKNVLIETRFAEGNHERLASMIGELLRAKVDVLVAASTPAATAAQRATTTVPIVFANVFDPVAAGIVPRRGRPPGNITGAVVGVGATAAAAKWLELLREAAPRVSHVAVLYNAANPSSAQSLKEVEAAAKAAGVKTESLDAGSAAKLEAALTAIRTRGARGMIVTNDAFLSANRPRIISFARRRLPAVYPYKSYADAGGLMSYGGSIEDSFRRAAALVDRILKGARPADLSIDQPTTFELVINLKTAKALGLTIPPSLRSRADRLIE
jgi:putative ABC transport system substrate-binding protein